MEVKRGRDWLVPTREVERYLELERAVKGAAKALRRRLDVSEAANSR